MSLRQISVFVEREIGALSSVTEDLAKNAIDIRALSITAGADGDYLRLIVNDSQRAYNLLHMNGYNVSTEKVIAVSLIDAIGSFDRVIKLFDKKSIRIEYAYSLVVKSGSNTIMVICPSDIYISTKVLADNGYDTISSEELIGA